MSGYSPMPLSALALAIEDQPRAAVLEANAGAVAGLDGDRPFLALGPPPVEACGQRPVRFRAVEGDVGGDRGLRILRKAELGLLDEQAAGEDLGRDREGVDPRIEHAEAARLPDPLLARMPFVDVLVPVDLHRLDALAGKRLRRRLDGRMVLRVPGGEQGHALACARQSRSAISARPVVGGFSSRHWRPASMHSLAIA